MALATQLYRNQKWKTDFFFFCCPASYKKIDTGILKIIGTDEVELTCQARGYPLAEVSWSNVSVPANTSYTRTPEGFYQVTSVLRLKPQPGRNFSCMFWNANVKELTSAIIDPQGKSCPAPTSYLYQSEFRQEQDGTLKPVASLYQTSNYTTEQ